MGLLTHPGHTAAQCWCSFRIQNLAINLDTTLLHRQQACDLRQQQRLACTTGAPQRYMLAGLHIQGDRCQTALRTRCLHNQIRNTHKSSNYAYLMLTFLRIVRPYDLNGLRLHILQGLQGGFARSAVMPDG